MKFTAKTPPLQRVDWKFVKLTPKNLDNHAKIMDLEE